MNEKYIVLFYFCLFKGWYNIQVPVFLSYWDAQTLLYLPIRNL